MSTPHDTDRAVSTEDCWLYARGGLNSDGYATLAHKGKTYLLHRVMYENFVGKIPPGLVVDHLCRVRRCINPSHLEPVTNKENVLRGEGLTALNARRTHCIRGHEFDPTNTRTNKGKRYCRTCDYGHMRKYRERIKAESRA